MRLDQRMVDLGLADSRSRARSLIEAGAVLVDGAAARKPAQVVDADAGVAVTADPNPWVSRAALKLTHALDEFGLTPHGIALDIGASTGGFTEVLLARGADHVFALDVGHGQLHPKIAADPRVVSLERANARDLSIGAVPPVDWIVADVSFISLEKALPAGLNLAKPGATLVALIKPQFEAGPSVVGKGGIVRDPTVHEAVCARFRDWLINLRWQVTDAVPSPMAGGDGNREFLIAAHKPKG